MTNHTTNILFQSQIIALPNGEGVRASEQEVGTVVSNLMYFGFVLNKESSDALKQLSSTQLAKWWKDILPVIEKETGASVKMENFVVYKNFPAEVLEMTQAQYWMKQSLIYAGVDADLLNEDEDERPQMEDNIKFKVLSLSHNVQTSLKEIFDSLKNQKTRWNDSQSLKAMRLQTIFSGNVTSSDFGFKDNFILLALIVPLSTVKIADATDVLRFAVALSTQVKNQVQGNMTVEVPPLEKGVKFGKFTRSERRALLEMMENSKNLEEDAASRKDLFKKFFSFMHPGDFKFTRVKKVYDSLYNNKLQSFSGKVESLILQKDINAVNELKARPGDFLRRFMNIYQKLDKDTVVDAMVSIIPKLSTLQLLKLEKLVTVHREDAIYPPRGNWTKAQFVKNSNQKVELAHQQKIVNALSEVIKGRLAESFPEGVKLDINVEQVKLATNDQKLANYGRGTKFPIPNDVKYIRASSYWESGAVHSTIWYDNGFNFFNKHWESMGTVCWNSTGVQGAVFSGDPVNSKELNGRACQMIDLDLNQLKNSGVRYAVWNILCFSGESFSKAKEVLATMQFCEDQLTGKLFEPARAQMVFPLTGDNMTKYIAILDLHTNEVIYWDANLAGQVGSAQRNEGNGNKFKAFAEYLETLPTVHDLFKHAPEGKTPVVYSDENLSIDGKAYVFKPVNTENRIEQLDLSVLLK